MKKYFGLILAFTFLLGVAFAGNVNKSGTTGWHNYNSYASWDNSSGYHAINTDTLLFYKDSALSAGFYTTELRARGSVYANNVSQIPDSIHVCYDITSDSGGADTSYVGVQYSFDGSLYESLAAPVKLTFAANTNNHVFGCFTRAFIAGARFRGYYINNSADGDSSKIFHYRVWGK